MGETLLRINSLGKRYGSLTALEDVSFTLDKGEIVGLVGRRGAGKTSLLRILGGMEHASQGEILFNNRPLHLPSIAQARRAGIEIVHHTARLSEQLDAVNNIFLGREICWPARFGIPNQDAMYKRAKEIFADVDLPVSLLNVKAGDLTEEQRQVVSIARALIYPPRLLLLDDPLASLSYARQTLLLEHMRRLATDGSGIIVTSENLKHLFNITDRIIVLYEGRLIADRRTSDCTPRDIVELIVGSSNREQVTPIVWALESFHAAQRQTEELYRAQTALHQSLEASDSLNRKLIRKLSDQVKALDKLNTALQDTQRRLMTEREEERKALARDLHDQVIQDLLSFNYRLEEVEDYDIPDDKRAELDAIRGGIRQVVSDLRQLCQDLRPPTIDNHGLPSAIRSLSQEWAERCGMELRLDIDPALGRLPEAIELSVFRIVQEGLNNIRKHADARTVELSLRFTPMDSLMVRLADDGSGVAVLPDLGSLSASKHYGLLGISERAALLGGSMQVQSPPDGGMVLLVDIPSPYPSV